MKDTIIKGSGNSRLIKTVPNAPTLWPTHEALMQEWATNGLPIDLLGLNAAGVQQAGMNLNKANMLTDATEQAIWGSVADRTPDAALKQLRSLIATAQNTANIKGYIESGTYIGTGTYGENNPNSLTFSFAPAAIFMTSNLNPWGARSSLANDRYNWCLPVTILDQTPVDIRFGPVGSVQFGTSKSTDGKTVYWYAKSNDATAQFNGENYKYYYIAIG